MQEHCPGFGFPYPQTMSFQHFTIHALLGAQYERRKRNITQQENAEYEQQEMPPIGRDVKLNINEVMPVLQANHEEENTVIASENIILQRYEYLRKYSIQIQGICLGSSVGLANMCFLFIEASQFEEIRQIGPVTTLLLSAALGIDHFTVGIAFSTLGMAIGVLLTIIGEHSDDNTGQVCAQSFTIYIYIYDCFYNYFIYTHS